VSVEKLIAALKGIDPDSPVLQGFARLAEKRKAQFTLIMSPGDIVTNDRVMAAPVAPDLWYLFNHVNMLTWGDDTPADSFMSERLSFFEDSNKLQGIKTLKGIVSKDQVIGKKQWFTEKLEWVNEAKDWVQLIAFELRFKNQAFQYSTEVKMPDPPEDVVGYIMVPVGGPGVMEVITLVQESIIEAPGFSLPGEEVPRSLKNGTIDPLTNLFPPGNKPVPWIPNACYGRRLIEKTGVIPEKEQRNVFVESRYKTTYSDITSRAIAPSFVENKFANGTIINTKIELPMEKIYGKGVTEDGTYDPLRPALPLSSYIPPKETETGFEYGGGWVGKNWLRVWITRTDKWPVPGEFIGILVKPCPVPPHVWWFQRSSPILYAGNWMDTLDLTSGVVVERTTPLNCDVYRTNMTVTEKKMMDDGTVTETVKTEDWPTHPVTGTFCTAYMVKIHGVNSIQGYGSDFLPYEVEVGNRVAIWKNRVQEEPLQLKDDPILWPGGKPGANYLTRPDLAFDQMEQQEWGEPDKDAIPESYYAPWTTTPEYYTIFPITFFKEVAL
jgi:hypothetical protein